MLFSQSSVFFFFCAAATLSPLSTGVLAQKVMTHVVQVGDASGTKAFFPERIRAGRGDLVQFQFYPSNHSVAQGSFGEPCQPLEASTTGSSPSQGFWSGFMPVVAESPTMPTFSIVVNDTAPIWFYCATGPHCIQGMAGVINEPQSGSTLDAYKAAALDVQQAGIPFGSPPLGGSSAAKGEKGSSSLVGNIPSNASDTVGELGSSSSGSSSPVSPAAVPSSAGEIFVSQTTLVLMVVGAWFLARF